MNTVNIGYTDGRAQTVREQMHQLGIALLLTSPLVVRFILGIASLAWGAELLIWDHIFSRQNYAMFSWLARWAGLSQIQGEAFLATALLLHGVGVGYCLIRDRRASRRIHNIVNVYGFLLWAFIVVGVHLAVGGPVPLAITETLLTMGAFVSIAAVDLRVRAVVKEKT